MSLYSFGGFVLEQLPELDATFSKYTAIAYVEYGSDGTDTAGRSITLYASDEMLAVDANRNLVVPAGAMYQRYRLNLSGNTMGWELTESSTGTGNYASTSPIWANHNILNPDNVITIVGSDPVPFSDVSTDKTWVNAGGVKLPEFPASDEPLTRYDYIFKSPSFGGYLYFRSKSPAYMDSEISESVWFNEGDFQVSKYLTRYNKPYWDSFVTPWPVSPAYINKSDLVWHSEIYDRTTETTHPQSPDPTPWTLFDLKTFCIFLAAGLCMPPIPRGKIPPKTDILDNEWPIEWKMSEVAGNSNNYVAEEITACHVSNLAPTLEEINVMTVTATVDGNSITMMKTYSEDAGGFISASFVDTTPVNGMIALGVTSVPSLQDDIPVQAPGLYVYTAQTGDYEGLDIAFTLTKGGT